MSRGTRYGERVSHLLVRCPFCGRLCDSHTQLMWCGGCYCEYTIGPRGGVRFDPRLRTPRFAWAKALAKAGGCDIGTVYQEGESNDE